MGARILMSLFFQGVGGSIMEILLYSVLLLSACRACVDMG